MSVYRLRKHQSAGHWARRQIPVGTRQLSTRGRATLAAAFFGALLGLVGYAFGHMG